MNSFKRGIGYQIAKIVVTLAVAFIIALLTGKVHALSWNLDFGGEKTNIWPSQKVISHSFDSGGSQWIAFNNTFTNSSHFDFAVIQITSLTFSDSSLSISNSIFRFSMPSAQGASALCELQGSAIVCPIIDDYTYRGINIFWSTDISLSDTAFTMTLSNSVQYYRYHDNTASIANNTSQINSSINNDSVSTDSENSSQVSEWSSSTAENGTITQLITLPITLYTSILNNINGSCTSFSLGSLYGSDLTMSCIRIQDYVGSTLWNVIDILFSGFFILIISKKMIKVFNNISSMKEGDILD